MSDVALEVRCELDPSITLEIRVDCESDIWIGGSEFDQDRLLLSSVDARRVAAKLIELADANDSRNESTR